MSALGGALLTCCVFSKEPFGACVVATWAACYFAFDGPRSFRVAGVRYVKATAFGAAVVVAGLCLYMIPTGSMKHYIALLNWYRTLFRDPLNGYCVQLGIFRPSTIWEDVPRYLAIIEARFLNFRLLGFLSPFFLMAAIFITRRSRWLLATSLAAFAGALYAPTISLCFWNHYFVMSQSGTFFLCAMGLLAAAPHFRASSRPMRLWISGVVATVVALQVGPMYSAATPFTVNFDSAVLPETEPGIIAYIKAHSAPTDKVFTTGPAGLYVATDRLHAVRLSTGLKEYLPVLPGNTDAEKLRPLYQELVASRPKIVYLDPEHGDRKERHMNAVYLPFLREFQYVEVKPRLFVRPN
jgi:hypothetical protein